jgi:hypothetical protein
MSDQPKSQISRIAQEYFSLLARAFPVMCASDEFHFLPRVQEAAQWFDQIDQLSQEAIAAAVGSVRDLQTRLKKQSGEKDFEEEIDRQLLLHNMDGLLIELEEIQSWRHNPLIYLKIGCIGVDHALNKPADNAKECLGRTGERLAGLKGLLAQAGENLKNIPGPYHRAGLAMAEDAREYLEEILRYADREGFRKQLGLPCREAQEALAVLTERSWYSVISVAPDLWMRSTLSLRMNGRTARKKWSGCAKLSIPSWNGSNYMRAINLAEGRSWIFFSFMGRK